MVLLLQLATGIRGSWFDRKLFWLTKSVEWRTNVFDHHIIHAMSILLAYQTRPVVQEGVCSSPAISSWSCDLKEKIWLILIDNTGWKRFDHHLIHVMPILLEYQTRWVIQEGLCLSRRTSSWWRDLKENGYDLFWPTTQVGWDTEVFDHHLIWWKVNTEEVGYLSSR